MKQCSCVNGRTNNNQSIPEQNLRVWEREWESESEREKERDTERDRDRERDHCAQHLVTRDVVLCILGAIVK